MRSTPQSPTVRARSCETDQLSHASEAVGGALAYAVLHTLYPDVSVEAATDVVARHDDLVSAVC